MDEREYAMKGPEYEQFVRAVLCKKLGLSSEELRSACASGATLPNAEGVKHQVDLFYVQETEVAEYVTIVECKYRESRPVDQTLVQNLAFVRDSMRAHKAIMVTNKGFTGGAKAVAESQQIALLVVEPSLSDFTPPEGVEIDELFAAIQAELSREPRCCNVVVVQKLHGDPGDTRDLIAGLLADPEIRRHAEGLLRDPGVRDAARKLAADNPDLARKAMDFFRRGGF